MLFIHLEISETFKVLVIDASICCELAGINLHMQFLEISLNWKLKGRNQKKMKLF